MLNTSTTAFGPFAYRRNILDAIITQDEDVTVPEGVTEIGTRVCGAYRLSTKAPCYVTLTLPNTVRKLHERALAFSTDMTTVNLPDSLVDIGEGAFEDCYNLESVHIPPWVTEIKANTFTNCTSLRAVTGGEGLQSIDPQAFVNCPSLDISLCSPYIVNLMTPIEVRDGFMMAGNVLVRYIGPGGDVRIPDGVTVVGERAFCPYAISDIIEENVPDVVSVYIPDSLRKIGVEAFESCSSLESVRMPEGLEEICKGAFFRTAIKSLDLPGGVDAIGDEAFCKCEALESVSIQGRLHSIGSRAFMQCRRLVSVSLPDDVYSIADLAFYGCYKLENFSGCKNIHEVGPYSFNDCTKLVEAGLPTVLKNCGSYLESLRQDRR